MRISPLLLSALLLVPSAAFAGGWEKINKEDGVTVYSKEVKGSDLVAFKGVTTIKQPIGKVLSVLMNNARRTEWVDRLKTSKILKKHSDFEYVIYQHFELPIIMSDRDYVYRGKAFTDSKGNVILSMNSCKHPKAPETVGVRARLIRSRYKLIPKGKNKTTIEVEIHTDPKGMIPTWLVNMIQKSWPAKTLSGVRAQAKRKDVKSYPLPPVLKKKKKKKGKPGDVQVSKKKKKKKST